jgi:hypothetical protein
MVFVNSVNRPSVVIFCMVRPSNYGQNQTFVPQRGNMFGAAIGVVAAFFLVDRAHDVRLPTLEAVTPSFKEA